MNFEELLLRVGALLRRCGIQHSGEIAVGGCTLHADTLLVTGEGFSYELRPREFALLQTLLAAPTKIFTRQMLMDELWGYDSESDPRTVDTHIRRLREKLAGVPDFEIQTVRGLGYRAGDPRRQRPLAADDPSADPRDRHVAFLSHLRRARAKRHHLPAARQHTLSCFRLRRQGHTASARRRGGRRGAHHGHVPLNDESHPRALRAAREIAGGNYDVTVPERDRVEEFGELERNFNLMTAELRSNEYLRKDFISSVSHQLKTPLSILNGYAQLLAEGGLSETEEHEYSQYIAQESDRLVGLIDDMLRLSRIDHREIHRKAEIFPLGEQLRRAVLQLEPRWTEAGLSVSADIPDLDYVGDSELLYQVWVNLLENAVKFTPPGGRIGICLAAAADTVTVTVWDTGCGMDAETLPRIFEQFYQGDTDRRADGCGLGLTLCKRIVEQHGGTISAESRPGEGSRFSVALPAKAAKFM